MREAIALCEPAWVYPIHLAELCEMFEAVERGERVELCVSAPPRHNKTSTIIIGMAWLLARHPDWRLFYGSYNNRIARHQIRNMRKYAEILGVDFGDLKTKAQWDTSGGGYVLASGLGSAPTGHGFNLIVIDDPFKDRASAESRLLRAGIVEGFKTDIYTRTLPAPVCTSSLVTHTRWHVEDLIGELSSGKEGKRWRTINYPAIKDDGTALAPWLYPIEALEEIRDGGTMSAAGWDSLYMGRPTPKGGALFGAPTLAKRLPDRCTYTVGIDLAYTTKSRSDYSAIAVMAHDGKQSTIVEVYRYQGIAKDGRSEFFDRCKRIAAAYPGAQWGSLCATFEQGVIALMTAQGLPHIRTLTIAKDKVARAQAYADAWDAGRVAVYNSGAWVHDLLQEHAQFTGSAGDHDDQVDACVAAFETRNGGAIEIKQADKRERESRFESKRRFT